MNHPQPGRQPEADTPIRTHDRFLGCLLGGAVGDALGASVEFMSRAAILEKFGPDGITDYAPIYGGLGKITDDTQMMLFTAEGLLRGWVRGCLKGITSYSGVTAHAYQRWLYTQGDRSACGANSDPDTPGWLFQQRELHHRRAPGNTCLSALRSMRAWGEPAENDRICPPASMSSTVFSSRSRVSTTSPARNSM